MLGLSHRDGTDATVGEIDDALASLVDRLTRSADPFDRLRIYEFIDVQLDRRLDAVSRRERDNAA